VNKKKFKNILVVLGGTSGERAVSLESGKACIKALKKIKLIKKSDEIDLLSSSDFIIFFQNFF